MCDVINELATSDKPAGVIVAPIGFISDHMEVMFDLDEEVAAVCKEHDIPFSRAATVGTTQSFVSMIRELIEERLEERSEKRSLGDLAHGMTSAHRIVAFIIRAGPVNQVLPPVVHRRVSEVVALREPRSPLFCLDDALSLSGPQHFMLLRLSC